MKIRAEPRLAQPGKIRDARILVSDDWSRTPARKPVIPHRRRRPCRIAAVARPAPPLRRELPDRPGRIRARRPEPCNELKLRGDTVAVFVADYRMPQMSGIEFLEEAMDLYPMARRVLLTAYADTHAAIDAINVVDLDHYLLKPWDPPEEKLYPSSTGCWRTWRRDRRARDSAHQGDRHPGTRGPAGARVPGPQPAALHLVPRRRTARPVSFWTRPGLTG